MEGIDGMIGEALLCRAESSTRTGPQQGENIAQILKRPLQGISVNTSLIDDRCSIHLHSWQHIFQLIITSMSDALAAEQRSTMIGRNSGLRRHAKNRVP